MKLRWYQSEACDSAWSHLCGQAGNPVVVLPTGAGKSLVIAELCRRAVQDFKGRVMILAHRKELLTQNAEKVRALYGDVGLYSAGLNARDTDHDVVLAGIQSVHDRAEEFGARHLLLIDEAHLVPHEGEGMYRRFVDKLREINPWLRTVGLTATPYRTGEGALCRPDGLFQKICYDAPIAKLIDEGFLSRVTNQVSDLVIDTSGLRIRAGEFVASDMESLFDAKVAAACQELILKSAGRQSVLIFCAGVAHAQHVAEYIEQMTGEDVGVVTGQSTPLERTSSLERFRSRKLRFLCNVDVLTTGFDAPCIDCIAILRATCSPGLFAQVCGRGFRVYPGKQDFLVLDFGENIKRHGPINAIDFGKRKKQGGGDAPEKTCPNCESPCAASSLECQECGFRFPARKPNHGHESDDINAILSEPKRWIVEEVKFSRHRKKNAPPDSIDTLRVDYLCRGEGNLIETISEWVCLEHPGWAGNKAHRWWCARSNALVDGIDSAVDLFERGAVAAPTSLMTVKEGRFWRILSCELDPKPETWLETSADPFEDAPF